MWNVIETSSKNGVDSTKISLAIMNHKGHSLLSVAWSSTISSKLGIKDDQEYVQALLGEGEHEGMVWIKPCTPETDSKLKLRRMRFACSVRLNIKDLVPTEEKAKIPYEIQESGFTIKLPSFALPNKEMKEKVVAELKKKDEESYVVKFYFFVVKIKENIMKNLIKKMV
jgi:hypothetical protein